MSETSPASWVTMGHSDADPLSLDVRKLEIIADDIPANLKMSEILDTMEYEPVTIGGGDFLLPSASEETMVDSGGQAMRNRVQFSSCRQFAGQSVISFAGADADKPAEKAPAEDTVQELQLPRNLQLILHFSSDVDLENAAVGDQIRAELVQDVKLKGRLILPKGTLASGRITVSNGTMITISWVSLFPISSPGNCMPTWLRSLTE